MRAGRIACGRCQADPVVANGYLDHIGARVNFNGDRTAVRREGPGIR